MSVNFKPLADRDLVEPVQAETKTASGIIIPDTAKEKQQEGKVIEAGSGRYEDGKLVPIEVKVGDTVLYGKYSGTEVKQGGKEYLIVRESDILAVVK